MFGMSFHDKLFEIIDRSGMDNKDIWEDEMGHEKIREIKPGSPTATYYTPCNEAYILHEVSKCRNGCKVFTVCYGTHVDL